MSQKEEMRKHLTKIAKELEKEIRSNETCVKNEIQKINENWRMLKDELKGTVEFLQALYSEIKSKDLDKKVEEVENDLSDVEIEFEKNSCEESLRTAIDIDTQLAILKVRLFY